MIDEFERLAYEPARSGEPFRRVRGARRHAAIGTLLFGAIFAAWAMAALQPASQEAGPKEFEILPGEGFRDIAVRLEAEGVIRSAMGFQALALATGRAGHLQAGRYLLLPSKHAFGILEDLVSGAVKEVEIVIPPGATMYEIDDILARNNITKPGEILRAIKAQSKSVEGKLFPDTYRFFTNTSAETALEKLLKNFVSKAEPLLDAGEEKRMEQMILASLLEREVPEFEDRRIVAGILVKRVKAGMPIQVDATICYAKQIARGRTGNCLPITALDLKAASPYNTYLQRGWPPGPIGNPGLQAIQAALSPRPSPYWFYLSDPATHRTVFSETLDEHRENRLKYIHE
jgi:UPF0755 protein